MNKTYKPEPKPKPYVIQVIDQEGMTYLTDDLGNYIRFYTVSDAIQEIEKLDPPQGTVMVPARISQ